MKSVLQDWVMRLGLRHQGVLLTAVRGCDTAPKNDPSKDLTRVYRAMVLNSHCGDAVKAATFIELPDYKEVERRMNAFRKNLDHYPHHYIMHFMHAAQIIGYKRISDSMRQEAWLAGVPHENFGRHEKMWLDLYLKMCKGLHVNPETEEQMDRRLNADEETFAKIDKE